MNLIISLILGAILAYIVKILLEWIGVPSPLPVLGSLLTFIIVAFGGVNDKLRL